MCVKIAANGAGLAWRFGSPGSRVKMFDNNLVHAIIGGKDLDSGSAGLSVNLVSTPAHGPYSLTHNTSGPSENRKLYFFHQLSSKLSKGHFLLSSISPVELPYRQSTGSAGLRVNTR